MNWMIDGAHGDLYRRAMGYPMLTETTDEWAVERALGQKPRQRPRPVLAVTRHFTQVFGKAPEIIRLAFIHKEFAP